MRRFIRSPTVRWLLAGIVALLLAIQVVPVSRTNPPVGGDVSAPPDVQPILRRACYDCHSNETVWPWYSRIAPVSWLVASDVHEGRGQLNFSVWSRLTPAQQAKALREAWRHVADGEMPPWTYRLMHRDAGLSAEDRVALRAWTAGAPARAAPGSEP